jgi:hypothetical protein
VYRKGRDNSAADALSRQDHGEEALAMSSCQPKWLEVNIEGYNSDPETQKLLTELAVTGSNTKGFTLSDGIIRYKNRVWLGTHKEAHKAVMLALHDSGIGGHSGMKATYNKIKNLFAWPGMKQDIEMYVAACSVCKQAKPEHSKLPGTLQPLPVPAHAWTTISMNSIEGLPKSQNLDTILVIIDKFSKYAHFVPLKHPFTTTSVAHQFFHNIYKLHGLPQVIISDRDKVFLSTFWQELFKLSETTLNKLMVNLKGLINVWKLI